MKRETLSVQRHKVGDKSRLLWERYFGAMRAAANAMNAAIQNTESVLAGIIIEAEGYSTETHVLNTDLLEIIPRPRMKGQDNGTMAQ